MNIFLIIAGIIIILLSALLLTPITLYIEKLQGKAFKFKISFLTFCFDNNSLKASSKKKVQKPDKEDKEDKEAEETIPLSQKIKYYVSVIQDFLTKVDRLLSHIRIKNLYLKLVVAEGDAAFSAIAFGSVCSVVYPLLGIIENKTKVDKGAFDLDIRCDYNGKRSEYGFYSTLKLTPFVLLIIGIKAYFKLKKHNRLLL